MIKRGGEWGISFIPEIAAKECWSCQECFTICPTSYAQAAYFLTEALAFPGQRKKAQPPAPKLKPHTTLGGIPVILA